jgi:hypothetical protein
VRLLGIVLGGFMGRGSFVFREDATASDVEPSGAAAVERVMGGESFQDPAVVGPDPELEALPSPRRPWRRLTLATMALACVGSLAMSAALWSTAQFAMQTGHPRDGGRLASLELSRAWANRWVRAEGGLELEGAVRYQRPLSGDWFRLARVAGSRIWVELRVPAELEDPYFLPPPTFVGRLVPLASAGLRHDALGARVGEVHPGQAPAPGDWLLIDGESPVASRWAIGLIVLFAGFASFNVWGLWRFLRPIRQA